MTFIFEEALKYSLFSLGLSLTFIFIFAFVFWYFECFKDGFLWRMITIIFIIAFIVGGFVRK